MSEKKEESKELTVTTNKELSIKEGQDSEVGKLLNSHEATLGQHVAMRALELVKPMISSVAKELNDMLGDNERIIIIRKTNKDSPTSILILDTNEDFTIKSKKANRTPIKNAEGKITGYLDDGKFLFTGEALPGTKKPICIKHYYIAEEFVGMLLEGRLEQMSKKLME